MNSNIKPGAPALFAITLFMGACLLFVVQPMVGRLLLPSMGGASVVWNTCLVFFQAVLLAGYLYAHLVSTRLSLRWQMAVHAAVFVAAMVVLPITFEGRPPPSADAPLSWLLQSLGARVALPFFFISATAPLFQGWYARTGLPHSDDPYFLYAASNLGSMTALISYPLLVEPSFALPTQTWLWWMGYIGFGVVGAATAYVGFRRARAETGKTEPFRVTRDDSPPRRRIAWWVLCGLIPSALLVSVTTYLTTDVSSFPLLWVIPLALYLLSFIVVFARTQTDDRVHALLVVILPCLVLPLCLFWLTGIRLPTLALQFFLHLAVFFVVCLVFHGELVRTRPAADSSTDFYLWMSFGGVLGGAFSGLLAPALFNLVLEHPLLLGACVLLMPPRHVHAEIPAWVKIGFILLAAALSAAPWMGMVSDDPTRLVAVVSAVAANGLLLWGIFRHPRIFGTIMFVIVAVGLWHISQSETIRLHARSYFASYQVSEQPEHDRLELYHGHILHGAQPLAEGQRDEATTYYHHDSGIARMLRMLAEEDPPRAAIVGLGVGGLVAHAEHTEEIVFYEIDPLMVEIAREEFTYLDICGDKCSVIVGDGRLEIAKAAPKSYDIIVLDAYSSDSIPLHLITREAVELYESKLADGGVLAFHISNHHLELDDVVAALARDADMHHVVFENKVSQEELEAGFASSKWVFLSHDDEVLAPMHRLDGASRGDPSGVRVWTDNFADVLSAYKW